MPQSETSHVDRSFEVVLPRLVNAYQSGKLVPFIGAGMSAPACVGWDELIYRLEEQIDPTRPVERPNKAPESDELVRRANVAARTLRARSPAEFRAALERSLFSETTRIPAQTHALARLWWPLVLSTNYDNFYIGAFRQRYNLRRFDVRGRSASDCQRVLTSLTEPASSILWTLQGALGQPLAISELGPREDLAEQVVLGHDEYRRVTYRDVHFRRAFAEVFRNRSLLFLGSGIRETYVQELFGEVLEMYGPTTRPHYAIMPRGEVDPEFMLARFQIVVIEYPRGQHDTLPRWLGLLGDAIENNARRATGWTWGRSVESGRYESTPEFEVVRGPLPHALEADECLALSAGGPVGRYAFSSGIDGLLRDHYDVALNEQPTRSFGQYLGFYPEQRIWAVRARSTDDQRGLEHVQRASLELFTHAHELGFTSIRMQLLAAGGTEDLGTKHQSWRLRTFPERYSFVQIARTWAQWKREHPRSPMRLAVHVIAPPVYMEIASGRLDVLELLSCPDIRFWAEVQSNDDQIERRLFQEAPGTALRRVLDAFNLPTRGWSVEVTPAPNLEDNDAGHQDVSKLAECSLEQLGVVPGSTLIFRRT